VAKRRGVVRDALNRRGGSCVSQRVRKKVSVDFLGGVEDGEPYRGGATELSYEYGLAGGGGGGGGGGGAGVGGGGGGVRARVGFRKVAASGPGLVCGSRPDGSSGSQCALDRPWSKNTKLIWTLSDKR